MFPGRGHYTYENNTSNYNNQSQGYTSQGYQEYQEYQRPGVPPPGVTTQGYQEYQRPQGPPPTGNREYERQEYERPGVPPPGAYSDNGLNSSEYSFTNVNNNNNGYPTFVQPEEQYGPPAQVQVPEQTGVPFQYSQCTGRKKALLIGINYIGTSNQLSGCINDAHAMLRFLTSRFGYSEDDIVLLTDDQQDMARVPTRDNMLRAMQWLVQDARPNDSLVFHYSGHGGQTEDLDGDEEDGFDDVIYPVDFQQTSHITDDVMHELMVRPLPQGCRLTALFDSCHSGSALDLPYTYSTKGVVKEPNMYKELGQDGLQAVMGYAQGNTQALMGSITSIFKTVSRGGSRLSAEQREQVRRMKFSPADVVMLSGCKDNQTSADSAQGGIATGAMSWAFMNVLAQQPVQSYLTLLQNMRAQLATKYSQKPQLSSSHPIDVNIQFIM